MESSVTLKLEESSVWDEIASCTSLPSPPGVAVQMVNLAQHADTEFEDVERAVQLDPVMAAKLLRLANSSFYARNRKIKSLKQAIGQFGLNGTLTIALTFSLISAPEDSKSGLDHNRFWLRSLASGIICKKLAQMLSCGEKETFYLAGLLQDIGILVLDKIRPELYNTRDDNQADHHFLIDTEMGEFGLDHSDIGAWLLEQWQFPEIFVKATAKSHKMVSTDTDDEHSALASCVALSSFLAEYWSLSHVTIPSEMMSTIIDKLELSDDQIRKLLEETQKEIEEVSQLFDVSEITDAAVSRILNEATEGLTMRTLMTGQSLSVTQSCVTELKKQTQELADETNHLKRQLEFDNLTKVHTRGYALRILENYLANTSDEEALVSLLFVDLDDFKKINDTYGHKTGDAALKAAAQALTSIVREADVVARYGGEEFLIILTNTGYANASRVCDRLISTLANTSIDVASPGKITITASVGLSVHGEESVYNEVGEFIDSADAACYRAKNSGKNRWVPASVLSHNS